METKSIQLINKGTVNRICSGQVILSLSTAVKELIENSMDANSTNIQIRLQEYGSELIEVTDNGCGVQEENFEGLTLKHHTSKISDFIDLTSVGTFGFRGEALSSLCSLGKMTVITRHETADFGTKLVFDHQGKITQKTKIARQTGTTVIVEGLFSTLAVRHKEFLRNLKKEFRKFCNVLYAYGLQANGISICCTNSVSNKKIAVMDIKGESVKSNLMSIFGSKQSQSLVEFETILPDDETLEEFGLNERSLRGSQLDMYYLEGFISSCSHGQGRTSADRQFYFINSRPIDNSKVSKLVNEVYHQFNGHQYPFVVLNVKVASADIDVNVTPDKRHIFLSQEKILLATIKKSLTHLFRKTPSTLDVGNKELIMPTFTLRKSEGTTSFKEKIQQFQSSTSSSPSSRVSGINFLFNKKQMETGREVKQEPEKKIVTDSLRVTIIEPEKEIIEDKEKAFTDHVKETAPVFTETNIQKEESLEIHNEEVDVDRSKEKKRKKYLEEGTGDEISFEVDESLNDTSEINNETTKRLKFDEGISSEEKKYRKCVTCPTNVDDIKMKRLKMKSKENERKPSMGVKFFSKIDPQKNEIAENELKKELKKEMFKEMEILGQFNLGFIITKLRSDLFIVDQHASDEKYNFETLQQTTTLQNQKLVVPQPLELTIEKECLFLEHEDVIKKNGFDFSYDENAEPSKRVKLLSIPVSKNWIFGKSDIEELLFMLEDATTSTICRPSRVRAMFASRACRKSVMIGTALNSSEMRRLIDHMGEIDQPWNCPHGRPTIRHLLNLDMICRNED